MEIVKAYTKEELSKIVRHRVSEERVGDHVNCCSGNWKEDLANSDSKFVILGVAEDLGVRANFGRGGASTAFKPALDSFLNQHANDFLKAESIFVLGELFVEDLMNQSKDFDPKNNSDLEKLRDSVSKVDERLFQVIEQIIRLKKIPIVIGGGHNNSYGNIKGASLALTRKVNVINCDPHLDFRALEGRHSGNGFSYAFSEKYLQRYAVFAMHEQYNNKASLTSFKDHPSELFYNTFESIFVREEKPFNTALKNCIGFVSEGPCGLEFDLDAITNVPTSAKTSSGITPLQARQYVHACASSLNCIYFHVAEGAPVLSHIKADNKTGKLISYLITDFIKGITLAEK